MSFFPEYSCCILLSNDIEYIISLSRAQLFSNLIASMKEVSNPRYKFSYTWTESKISYLELKQFIDLAHSYNQRPLHFSLSSFNHQLLLSFAIIGQILGASDILEKIIAEEIIQRINLNNTNNINNDEKYLNFKILTEMFV